MLIFAAYWCCASADERVDIKGVDKVALLKVLWEMSSPASFFIMSGRTPPKWGETGDPIEAVKDYIDYFCGRMIKSDLTGDSASPSMYDRDIGEGSFARAVEIAKKQQQNTGKEL